MTVAELIEALGALPADAKVSMLWDGCARSPVEAVWLAQSGEVVVGPWREPVYDDEDRIDGAATSAEEPYLRVYEMFGLPEPEWDEDD